MRLKLFTEYWIWNKHKQTTWDLLPIFQCPFFLSHKKKANLLTCSNNSESLFVFILLYDDLPCLLSSLFLFLLLLRKRLTQSLQSPITCIAGMSYSTSICDVSLIIWAYTSPLKKIILNIHSAPADSPYILNALKFLKEKGGGRAYCQDMACDVEALLDQLLVCF